MSRIPKNSEESESHIQSLGWENTLEKKMATHVRRIPWTEEPGRAMVHGVAKSQRGLNDQHFQFQILI